MNNIIWNSLWTCDDWINKNFVYYINEIFNKIWVKRVKNDILLKNHKIVELLSIVEPDITNDVTDELYRLWLTYIWHFSSENDELSKFLENNKSDIKTWKILFWFFYEGLKISHVVFVSQYVDTKYIDNIINDTKKDINKSLPSININI